MKTYTPEEKWYMIKLYLTGNSMRRVCEIFAEKYPDRPVPVPNTIREALEKMDTSQCLHSAHEKTTRPNRQLTEETKTLVCAAVEENPGRSSQNIAEELNIGKASVLKILRENKYFPFKIERHQVLQFQDPVNRLQFCEDMIARIQREPDLPGRIIFTDESTFVLVHGPNRQNCRLWNTENPHEYVGANSQYQLKLNVWSGIVGTHILGPFFIDGNLDGEKYFDLLIEHIGPALEELNIEVSNLSPLKFLLPPDFPRVLCMLLPPLLFTNRFHILFNR